MLNVKMASVLVCQSTVEIPTKVVDQNALEAKSVLETKHVLETNVEILAREFVDKTLSVMLSTIYLVALVCQITLVILSLNVTQWKSPNYNQEIHATHHHVDLTAYVEPLTTQLFVLVLKDTKALLQLVGQNVSLVRSARLKRPVLIKSVLIRVLTPVVYQHAVKLLIIVRFVAVTQGKLEIHLRVVMIS